MVLARNVFICPERRYPGREMSGEHLRDSIRALSIFPTIYHSLPFASEKQDKSSTHLAVDAYCWYKLVESYHSQYLPMKSFFVVNKVNYTQLIAKSQGAQNTKNCERLIARRSQEEMLAYFSRQYTRRCHFHPV